MVSDLDNTRGGGVVGEDGINGIRVGPDHPGVAYLAVRLVLLDDNPIEIIQTRIQQHDQL